MNKHSQFISQLEEKFEFPKKCSNSHIVFGGKASAAITYNGKWSPHANRIVVIFPEHSKNAFRACRRWLGKSIWHGHFLVGRIGFVKFYLVKSSDYLDYSSSALFNNQFV